MLDKQFCVSNIFYVMMGLAGIATPFINAVGAEAAKVVSPAKVAVNEYTSAEGKVDNNEPIDGAIDAPTQTKVVVTRAEIDKGDTQAGYAEATKGVPGVANNGSQGTANDSVKFRGIQLGLYTNYRLNGGLAITNVISIPTENKERVEALKGANALVFGFASPSGIINLITKRPADIDVSTLTLSGNDFGQYGAAVDLSRKFGDERQFGLRLNASGTHLENGITNGGDGKGQFGSVGADWQATKALSFKLDYENYRKDVTEQGTIAPLAAVKGVIVVPRVPNPVNMLGAEWGDYTPRTVNKTLRGDYLFSDDWKLLVEIGTSDSERSRVQARTTGNYNIATGAATMQIQWIKNQQYDNKYGKVELDGRFDLGPVKNDAALGYSSTERAANNPFGFGSATTPINLYNPLPIPQLVDPNKPARYAPSDNQEKSLYVYDTLGLTPSLKVLLGVRKSDAQFKSTDQKTLVENTSKSSPTAPGAGVLWDVAPGTTLYGSYMRAVEDGPTAPSGDTNEFQILAPTESTQKEIGVRTEYVKGFRANIDYFDIVRANAVANQAPGPLFNTFLYDGTVHLRGFEIAASARLNRAWLLDGTLQLMHGTQQTVIDPTLTGKTPENEANVIGTFNATYNVASIPGLAIKGGANYIGQRFVNAQDQATIPGVTLFSTSANYQTKIGGYKTVLQVAVANLANKLYWSSVTSSAYGYGMERAIRFNAKFDF